MVRKCFSRITTLLLAVVVAFGLICFNIDEVSAKSSWNILLPGTMYVGMDNYVVDVAEYSDSDGMIFAEKIIKATSSNESVIKIKGYKADDQKRFIVVCKKTGKSKITVKFEKPDGTTGTAKMTIRVKKYPNQIKSLKINGKAIKTSKYKYQYYKGNYKKSSVKIKMALKTGWKISYVNASVSNYETGETKEIKVSKSTIKKGKAIKFPESYDGIDINIGMVKGDENIHYYIGLGRD